MQELRNCNKHGLVVHHKVKDKCCRNGYRWRCKVCMAGYVVKRKRKVKATLIAEAGGSCQICGYDKCVRALGFHHIDPAMKLHGMDMGLTKSLDAFRKEAKKCILLCANCHMEVESGMVTI